MITAKQIKYSGSKIESNKRQKRRESIRASYDSKSSLLNKEKSREPTPTSVSSERAGSSRDGDATIGRIMNPRSQLSGYAASFEVCQKLEGMTGSGQGWTFTTYGGSNGNSISGSRKGYTRKSLSVRGGVAVSVVMLQGSVDGSRLVGGAGSHENVTLRHETSEFSEKSTENLLMLDQGQYDNDTSNFHTVTSYYQTFAEAYTIETREKLDDKPMTPVKGEGKSMETNAMSTNKRPKVYEPTSSEASMETEINGRKLIMPSSVLINERQVIKWTDVQKELEVTLAKKRQEVAELKLITYEVDRKIQELEKQLSRQEDIHNSLILKN